MNDAVIVAVITAFATIIGQWLISKSQHDKDTTDLAVTLKGIEDRLDEHNNYASKIGGLAEDVNKITVSMAEMKKDIEYLRKGTSI